MSRRCSTVCAILAFLMVILMGLMHNEPADTVIWKALAGAALFFLLGMGIGTLAENILKDVALPPEEEDKPREEAVKKAEA